MYTVQDTAVGGSVVRMRVMYHIKMQNMNTLNSVNFLLDNFLPNLLFNPFYARLVFKPTNLHFF